MITGLDRAVRLGACCGSAGQASHFGLFFFFFPSPDQWYHITETSILEQQFSGAQDNPGSPVLLYGVLCNDVIDSPHLRLHCTPRLFEPHFGGTFGVISCRCPVLHLVRSNWSETCDSIRSIKLWDIDISREAIIMTIVPTQNMPACAAWLGLGPSSFSAEAGCRWTLCTRYT